MQEVRGGLKYHYQFLSPEIKWKVHWIIEINGFVTTVPFFSIELNGHGVIVDGVRGLYFCPIFRRCKIIPWNKKLKPALDSQDQGLCTYSLGCSIKLNDHGVIVDDVFQSNFLTMQEVLGELKYYHQLLSPEIKWNMHQRAEIKGYAPAVQIFQSN